LDRGWARFNGEVGAELLRQVVLERAAANTDDGRRAAYFCELNMQLTGYTQAHHGDRSSFERRQLLRMQTSGGGLDERRSAAIDGIGKPENLTRGNTGVFGESTVGFAADKSAGGAEIGPSAAAVEASAARKCRIDDYAVSAPDAGRRRAVDQLADHFVTHDERIFRRDRPRVNFEIRAAQAAVGDAHQDATGRRFRTGDLI